MEGTIEKGGTTVMEVGEEGKDDVEDFVDGIEGRGDEEWKEGRGPCLIPFPI